MWKWNSLKELLERLNKLEYVILRNYENLEAEIANGGDIDILCANRERVVNQIYAYPRVPGNKGFNYYILIVNKKIPIDIREVGDGYYDEAWETSILRKRVKAADYYIMDDENYKYSLLYHALLHKPVVTEKNMSILEKLFEISLKDSNRLERILGSYLCKRGYSISTPIDTGVKLNEENCRKLSGVMKNIID